MFLDFNEYTPFQRYHLMTQSIIPRPIAWVMTENKQGEFNLAPFSYFTAISSDPALVMISVGKKNEEPYVGDFKDTRINLEHSPFCTIHIAHSQQAEAVTKTAATLALDESELNLIEHQLVDMPNHPVPRVQGSPIAMGCKLYEIQEIGSVPQTLIFLEVQTMFVEDKVAVQDDKGRLKIDAMAVDPLARLGGGEYTSLGAAFSIQRPK